MKNARTVIGTVVGLLLTVAGPVSSSGLEEKVREVQAGIADLQGQVAMLRAQISVEAAELKTLHAELDQVGVELAGIDSSLVSVENESWLPEFGERPKWDLSGIFVMVVKESSPVKIHGSDDSAAQITFPNTPQLTFSLPSGVALAFRWNVFNPAIHGTKYFPSRDACGDAIITASVILGGQEVQLTNEKTLAILREDMMNNNTLGLVSVGPDIGICPMLPV